MSLLMVRYALCPVCTGAGYVQAHQGGPCDQCHGTGQVQHGGQPRFRVHPEADGRWTAVSVDGPLHQRTVLCWGSPTREAAVAHAVRLGYLLDPRQPVPPVPAQAGDVAQPGAAAAPQLPLFPLVAPCGTC